jgi:hypothetical protein
MVRFQAGGNMPKKTITLTVSKAALMARINRRLAKDGQRLYVNRGVRWNNDLGNFYVLNLRPQQVLSSHDNLEDLGRQMEVLQPFEKLE